MKNLLLFSIFLLTTVSVFAQLTVRPNGASESFIYVDDEVLFVEKDVRLFRNNANNDLEASIYLRNNGQLVQGNNNRKNKKSGQLSVQQNTPVTNAWAYYYWCSPVGDPGIEGNPTDNGNQNFGVGLIYEPTNSTTAAQQVATTTGLNGSTGPLRISTRWLYTFVNPGTEREGNYQAMGGGLNAPPGFGFTMKGVGTDVPGGDQIYEFRGRPNNGTFEVEVKAPVNGEAQMTFTGNPYPSALDLNKLFYDNGNGELGAIWYYDENRSVASHYYSQKPFGYGVWVPDEKDTDANNTDNFPSGFYTAAPFYIYNAGGSTGTGAGTGGADQNKRYAPIGQGFMFVGEADGTVKIRNKQRVFYKEDTAGSVFQRPESVNSYEGSDSPETEGRNYSTVSETASLSNRTPMMRLWAIFDRAVTRDMVIAFYDQATDGYDRGLDGLSAQDLHTDAYFPIGPDNARLPYVINGTNYVPEKYIPIAFKIRNTSLIELRLVEEINQPYERAYLYDSQENTYKQLNGATLARVTLTLPPGTYDNRFFIFFRGTNRPGGEPDTELDIKSLVAENVSFFQNNPGKQLEVRNPEGYVIKAASVYDMSGKLVISEKNLGDNTKFSFFTGNLSSGVYLVKLITENDIVIDYKAVVHNQ
ncbi:T9SS type A sorting domain-containing protein [Aequorivita sp. F47161]|uniref:T9SS type A sorting domain-containing protein n=1 Tax=Aequorivita vitellina TaxID=2874475 RepID=A0A9X1QW42_9FLAO|nr:T9SS type A sorting domain-containing protein [Aequorivita vitellina]MCG2418899.1 T9SS type A sorting domain-containing protein [Aequorivita vitellina]